MFIQSTQHIYIRHQSISIKGFTLIELMITIAIVAILASIALPAYQGSVLKAGRSDGRTSLLSAAQAMERCFTTTSAYNDALCVIPATSGEGRYTLAIVSTPVAFTITATPVGSQTGDTECGNLTLNHAGQRGFSGSTGTIATCW